MKIVEKKSTDVTERVRQLVEADYRIHYNVWTDLGITEFFIRTIKDQKLNLEIEAIQKNRNGRNELITVLRKIPEEQREYF